MKLKKNNISDWRTPEHVWAVFQSKLRETLPEVSQVFKHSSTGGLVWSGLSPDLLSLSPVLPGVLVSLQTIYQSVNDLKP